MGISVGICKQEKWLMYRKWSMKKKVLILLPIILAALGGFVWLFFFHTMWIPSDMRIANLVQTDIFRGSHMQLGNGSKLLSVDDVEYVSHDDRKRHTVYRFTMTDTDGTPYQAEAYYPGTPKRQYYRYPRLRDSMKLVILTDPEEAAKGNLRDAYWLFILQEIDGETYAYPLLMDDEMTPYTLLGERVDFKYQEESLIYDPWYDADVLKKCVNPEYAYKVRYNDLQKNYWKILY